MAPFKRDLVLKTQFGVNRNKMHFNPFFNTENLIFMHETIKFYVTVRFALSEKLALKTQNVLIKTGVFR